MFKRSVLAAALIIAACNDVPIEEPTQAVPPRNMSIGAAADTFIVTNNLDTSLGAEGSLRWAIMQTSNTPAVIKFAPSMSGQTITLTVAELTIASKRIHIDATGTPVTIDGNNAFTIFNLAPGTSNELELTNVTLQHGRNALDGGAILNAGVVTLNNCTLRNNSAGRFGGAIANYIGSVTINNSRIEGNTASGNYWNRGAGIYSASGTVTLNNSTLYQNVFPQYYGDGAQVAITGGTFNMKGGTMYGDFVTFQAQNAPGFYLNGGTATIDSATIYGFRAAGPVGPVAIAGGSLTLTRTKFGPSTVQPEPNGAQLHVTGGSVVANFNRFVDNNNGRAVYAGPNATVDINDNFWGCNTGPNTSGCSGSTGFTPATWMVVKNTPSTPQLDPGQTATVTLDWSHNSAGAPISNANLFVLMGKTIEFAPALGTVSPTTVTINTNGGASATFTAGNTTGQGNANARILWQDPGMYRYTVFPAAIQIGALNAAPTANAGNDQAIECTGASTSVTLNGAASSDPDNDALTYTWKEGANVVANGVSPTVALGHGAHTLTLTVGDGNGHTASDDVVINIQDTQPPVLTLNGPASLTVEFAQSTYSEQGASAADACDGSVTVHTTGSVNTNAVGDYTITYSASDSHGHTATATRVVHVTDTTAPVVTLNGAADVNVELGGSYTEQGATASDVGNGSIAVQTSGSVNPNAVGTYTLTYTATDPSGNHAQATRVVHVRDTTAPVITVGAAPMVLTPPNHKYVTVDLAALNISVQDQSGASASAVRIVNVTSNEPDNGLGDGDTPNDVVVASNGRSVQLRAERSGNGTGRVYTLHLAVTDANGNTGTATYEVKVPKGK